MSPLGDLPLCIPTPRLRGFRGATQMKPTEGNSFVNRNTSKIAMTSLIGLGLVASGALASQATAIETGDTSSGTSTSTTAVAEMPTLVGAAVQPVGDQSYRDARIAADQRYGNMEAVRYFDPNLPNSWTKIKSDVGDNPVVFSFKASPQAINAGTYDAQLRAWFAGAPTDQVNWWSYNPEPETDISSGRYTSAQYKAAWSRLNRLADAAGNTKLKSTLALMCYTLSPASKRDYRNYYVADAVDVMSWDCYNWGHKQGIYADPSTSFDKVVALSRTTGKPWAIAETGSVLVGSDTGAGRADWLRKVGRYADANNARFVTYFDVKTAFEYRLRDSASRTAWSRVVDNNYS